VCVLLERGGVSISGGQLHRDCCRRRGGLPPGLQSAAANNTTSAQPCPATLAERHATAHSPAQRCPAHALHPHAHCSRRTREQWSGAGTQIEGRRRRSACRGPCGRGGCTRCDAGAGVATLWRARARAGRRVRARVTRCRSASATCVSIRTVLYPSRMASARRPAPSRDLPRPPFCAAGRGGRLLGVCNRKACPACGGRTWC
jgi:hypothetical protein